MKNLIIFLLAALMPVLAQADPGINSDTGRSEDTSQSESYKQDQSLSKDKSRGKRETESDSREKANEHSRLRSHSEKVGRSLDKSKSYSVDVNINGLLLREFTARYERVNDGGGKAGQYFNTCKPLLNLSADFPVINMTGKTKGPGMWHGAITGRNNIILSAGDRASSRTLGITKPYFESGGSLSPQDVDPEDNYVSSYAQCRITASYWVAEAGSRASVQQVTSEEEVRDRIRYVFVQMDADDSLFDEFRQQAQDLWLDANCTPFLRPYINTKEPDMNCGIFSVVGRQIIVEYRETLSESSINGRSYKIAINAQESQSVAADDSVSTDARVSRSERESDSRERFKEAKEGKSMSDSMSNDRSKSSKVDRRSGSSMSATPKE